METALPMLLFLAFLIGFGFLIVLCGYKSREQERQEASSLADLALGGQPRFFGGEGERELADPVAVVVDRSAVEHLERFLREEMQLAEMFASNPTVERLHAPSPGSETAAPLFARIEAFLRRENEAVASFVLHPSVENLYRPAEALASA